MDLSFGTDLPDLDILIVGAGLSGLTSGVKILSKEYSLNLKIIDENGKPGGLLGNNSRRFISVDQKEMVSFMNHLNVSLRYREEPDDEQLSRCWDLDRGIIGTSAKFELHRYISMLDMRMKKFSSLRFKFHKRVPNMERHICSNLFFSQSRNFMFSLVELLAGMPAKDIKYDEFMCLCSSCGGLYSVISIFIEMPSTVMDLSCTQLLETLLDRLSVVDVLCNVKAVKVNHFKDYVQVTDAEGNQYTAQALILAIPWHKVEELEFEPPLPNQFNVPSKSSHKARMITQYYIRYNRSYWITQGYSGQFLNTQPLVVGYQLRPTEYSGYIMHSREQSSNVKETVLELLAEHFGEEMYDPNEYKQETSKLNTALLKPQTKPWKRVIWSSSSAGATYNRNLMGGAVQSGIRAAINALFVVRPQVVCWKDLLDVQERKQYTDVSTGRISGLVSRINLYNVIFYGAFVVGLITLLNLGYNQIM